MKLLLPLLLLQHTSEGQESEQCTAGYCTAGQQGQGLGQGQGQGQEQKQGQGQDYLPWSSLQELGEMEESSQYSLKVTPLHVKFHG